ncbi:MAG: DUF892 family protein [Deltaproteobacteria bacterium]|nr:MAG: DUF892 family protein [Deltaproteobacteria bacterium]
MDVSINRKKVTAYCGYELDRLIHANRGICALFSRMATTANDPLLRGALEEQLELNRELLHVLYSCCEVMDRDARAGRDTALDALMAQGEAALELDDPSVRDLVMATFALRCLHWTLAGCASLASLWRHLDGRAEGQDLERFVYRFTGAREQLEWMFEALLRRGLDRATPEVVQRHQIPIPS